MTYELRFGRTVKKDLRRIPGSVIQRVQEAIAALKEDPFPNGYALVRNYKDCYRIRVGEYRVIYQVAREIRIVLIVKIGHRKDIYRKLQHYFTL